MFNLVLEERDYKTCQISAKSNFDRARAPSCSRGKSFPRTEAVRRLDQQTASYILI